MKRIALAWFRFIYLTLLEFPIQLFGLIINAIAIPFRKEFPETTKPFSDPRFAHNQGNWMFVDLPKMVKWFGNPYDGLWGDKRGWWDNNCREKYNKPCDSFVGMYVWSAIRNPANYFNRKVIGCDVSNADIVKLAGNADVVDEKNPGWHTLLATDKTTKKDYIYFGCFLPYFFKKERGLFIRLGWKIKLSHIGTLPDAREQDRFKGNTIRFNIWKEAE